VIEAVELLDRDENLYRIKLIESGNRSSETTPKRGGIENTEAA